MNLILGRELLYNLELTGVSGGLSMMDYYICSMAVLFLLLWGIAAVPFLGSRNTAAPKLLCAKGLLAGRQILAEYLSYTMLLYGCFLGASVLFKINAFLWLVGMLPVVLLFAMTQLCICEWIPDLVTAALTQFLGAAGLGYLSGCFYPITFFPAEIQLLASFLPTGAAMRYSGKLLTGQPFVGELVVMGIYGIGCFALAVLIRRRRLAR